MKEISSPPEEEQKQKGEQMKNLRDVLTHPHYSTVENDLKYMISLVQALKYDMEYLRNRFNDHKKLLEEQWDNSVGK